ncbi:MAG TPA: DUF2505 domain-containing protein [Marmoricola sp.]|nr:DUF2505 domain-containing protein [Marmoricola sp.]
MKRVQHDLRYDGATVEQVFDMLATQKFREAVCDYQRVLHRTVTVERNGESASVTIDQGHATDRLPGFARKIVGEHITMVQEESWSDGSHGRITVTVPDRPGKMTGTATLVGDADGVTEKVDMTVTVHLPLVGGKVEGLIADMLGKALRAEHTVGKDWLAKNS